MMPGSATAFWTASLVISWNRTLWSGARVSSWSATCHAIASPSRSGSVARYTARASLAACFSSFRVLVFPLIVTYSGWNPLSTSTPSFRVGRSRTCPIVALTLKPRPRYLPMLLALVGDSTTTSASPFPPTARVGSGLRVRFRGLVTAEGSDLPLLSAGGLVATFLRDVRLAAVLVFCVAMAPILTTSFLRRYYPDRPQENAGPGGLARREFLIHCATYTYST